MKIKIFSSFSNLLNSFILNFFIVIFWLVITSPHIHPLAEKYTDEWEISSLSDEGMNEEKIASLTEQIRIGKFKGIHSFLIVKNGKLVHEVYFKGYNKESLQEIFSITKSVSSTLIGITVDKGFIENVEQSMIDLLPQYKQEIKNPNISKIKLKHILTLSTGLEWYERSYSYSDSRNTETKMVKTNDWMKFVLTRPQQHEPGTVYNYNTGSVHLLSAIIKNASDLYADEFAEKYLFKPLGIKVYHWNKDKNGYPCTGATHGGLRLRARDLAKFGLMILRDGNRKGRQIVSQHWVEKSTIKQMEIANNINSMGYLWWPGSYTFKEKKISYIASFGYGGQTMYIVPDLDLVFIFLCWTSEQDADVGFPAMMTIQAALNN